jgi:hypothetical protein
MTPELAHISSTTRIDAPYGLAASPGLRPTPPSARLIVRYPAPPAFLRDIGVVAVSAGAGNSRHIRVRPSPEALPLRR